MTPEDEKQWNEYRAKRAPKLRATLKKMEDKGKKNNKYWHERVHLVILEIPAETQELEFMKLCVECMTYLKKTSIPRLKHWMGYWWCFVGDVTGEAHCKVGTPHYPRMMKLAEGKEKEKYEEIIELGHQYYVLTEDHYDKRRVTRSV